MSQYVPAKYATLQDALLNLGWTTLQINAISKIEKARYQDWVREGNNLVESFLFSLSNDTPLAETSKEFAYAKSATLNWVVYKKRDKEGSRNATNAKADHKADLDMIERLLIATRTTRTETASILGPSPKNSEILLPSQIDTAFY